MRVPRVILTESVTVGEEALLALEEGRHLLRVLRRGPGDPVTLLAAGGRAFEGVIARVEGPEGGPPRVWVRIAAESSSGAGALLPWTVGVALVKGDAFDLAIRLACEVGLEEIIPLVTERTESRPRDPAAKGARWARLAQEAAKQCGRARPLVVEAPRPFDLFLEEASGRKDAGPGGRFILHPGSIVPSEGPGAGPGSSRGAGGVAGAGAGGGAPAGVAPEAPEVHGPPGDTTLPSPHGPAVFAIGPEGGFSGSELSRARACGFQPLAFGTPTLRTPSAVAFLGALGLVLRELAGPRLRVPAARGGGIQLPGA